MRQLDFVVVLFSVLLGALACSSDSEEITQRDYRVYVGTENPVFQQQFKLLVKDFNESVGLQILNYASSNTDVSSPISLIAGLQASTGKLGYGGVVYNVERSGMRVERTASMQIDLDMEYVRARVPSAKGAIAYDDLRLLFFHEVGHGLGFAHVDDQNDLMYPDLNGYKDFIRFYAQVRNIYND